MAYLTKETIATPDLIDRKEAITQLKSIPCATVEEEVCKDLAIRKIKRMPAVTEAEIKEQPTAYDIDKVVEELESFAKLAEDRWVNGTSKHAYQEHKCWVKAIEIVKNGCVPIKRR